MNSQCSSSYGSYCVAVQSLSAWLRFCRHAWLVAPWPRQGDVSFPEQVSGGPGNQIEQSQSRSGLKAAIHYLDFSNGNVKQVKYQYKEKKVKVGEWVVPLLLPFGLHLRNESLCVAELSFELPSLLN